MKGEPNMGITIRKDPIGTVVWATRCGDDHIALAWFARTTHVMYVIEPFEGTGIWVTIDNPEYNHADNEEEFRLLAADFFNRDDA